MCAAPPGKNYSMNPLSSNVHLKSSPKGYVAGLEKAVHPSETVRSLKRLLADLNLDLVRETVRIDSGRLNIPVYVCVVGKDCNTPTPKTMGKGPSPDQSEASALMEMVERFSHANFPRPETHRKATPAEIRQDTLPADHFFRIPGMGARSFQEAEQAFRQLPFSWVPAFSLAHHRDFLVPYEWFADIQGTNGLSAGNTLEETVLQGLCEVVERHVCAVINHTRRALPLIDLRTVRDTTACELLGKFSRNGIELLCMDFSLNTGIPTVGAIAFDPASFPDSEVVYCAGTATHPEKALIRVLTEIQQMAVDYFKQDYYAGGILPKFRNPREALYLFDPGEPVSIQSLPDVSSDDMLEEIQSCTSALMRIGFEPLVINITHPVLGIPAVFVLMAGSQLYENSQSDLNSMYYVGRRLEFIGRGEEAIHWFRRSMEECPRTRLHGTLETANCLKYAGQWKDALETYKEAYRFGPDRAMQLQIIRSMEICVDRMRQIPPPGVPSSSGARTE